MQTDETPGQLQAFQPEDFHPQRPPPTEGALGAGECGDPIWEGPPGTEGAAGSETGIPPGRLIDLVERQRRREVE